ncbi:MAG: fimbrillin family protein [Prevotella sp.]|nr:fimbrillin family protein [Prevotella sp.]
MAFIALFAMTFAACSSSDDAQKEQGTQLKLSAGITAQKEPYNIGEWGTEIQIGDVEAAIAKEFKIDTVATRTPSDDSDWAGMTDRSIAVKIGNTIYKYSVDASGNLTSNTPYYFTTTSNVAVSSWYPYTSTALSSFSVQSDQTSYANREKSDLLYGTTTVNQGSANVISYSHKVAKLIVSVKVNNTQHIANGTISKLTMSGIKLSGTVSNGTLTASGSNGTITLHNTIASSTSNNNSTATYEAYLIPQTTTSTFVVSVGGTNLSIAVPSKTFAAGKIQTLELIYNVAGSGTENGHAWVRVGTAVKWAVTNVGANNDYNYGNHYQWGAKDVYANTYPTDNYYKELTNITPTSGYDIARNLWGSTWRLPTITEYNELYNKCTWTRTTKSGVRGMQGTSKINGNTIFIPQAGYLINNIHREKDVTCEYWTSIASTSKNDKAGSLRFESVENYSCTIDGTRWLGKSVRPVCD